jgi:hypothetical protein
VNHLFGRQGEKPGKSKVSPPVLSLYDPEMRSLYHDRLDAFTFPEAVILAASKEFFNDPAPCEIHRRAVQLRLCGEISEALPLGRTIPMEELPPLILLYCQDIHPAFVRLDAQ